MIKFRSHGEELKDILSGKINKISREIDRHNPVFEELEDIQALYHCGEKESLGIIYILDDNGYRIDKSLKIKKISYKDGSAIIEW